MTTRPRLPSAWIAVLAAATLLVGAAAARPALAAKTKTKPPPTPIAFSDIPWLTPADSVIAALGSRGYREVEGAGAEDVIACEGRLFDHQTLVSASLDERRRLVRWTVTILAAPTHDDYASMRRIYDDITTESGGKYGLRERWSDKFRFPYEKGDGREADALDDGCATIFSEWGRPGAERLRVEMDRRAGVALTYESPAWSELQARLRKQKARDI